MNQHLSLPRFPFGARPSTALLLILASLLPVRLAGQSAAERGEDSLRVYRSREVLIEAFRAPLGLDSVPYAVSIARARPGGQGLGLDELLAGVPGVQVDNRFNYAVGDRIVMRGFGARTQFGVRGVRVVADGIPATFADGQSALEVIDPEEIERAEVIRGPASAIYGNASGGVLLLRGAPAPAAPVDLLASMTAGAYGLLRAGTRVGGTAGPFSYQLDLSRFAYDGYRAHSASSARRAGTELRYRLGDADELRLNAGYVYFTAENPGSLSDSLLRLDPRQAFASNVRMGTGKDGEQGQAGLGWNHRFEWGTLDLSSYAIRRAITNPIPGRIIALDRTAAGAGALLHGSIDLAGAPLDWAAGIDLDLQLDDRQNYINQNGSRGTLALDQDERVAGTGAFVQLLRPIAPALRVMASLRYDRTAFDVTDRFIDSTDPDDSGQRMMSAMSPSAGILWAPIPEATLYANVATAFETPTTTELANRPSGAGGFSSDLRPQRAVTFEIGGRGRLGTLLSYQLALFEARITDALIPFQVPGAPERDYFRNAGSARHRGVEGALMLKPADELRLRIGAAWIDARFERYAVGDASYDGNRVPGIEPLRIDAGAAYTAPAGWYLGADMRHVGATFADDRNSASAPAYTIFNVRAGHIGIMIGSSEGRWSYSIAPFIGVGNVFDAGYNAAITINAFGGRFFEPGAGRTVYGGIELGVGQRD